MSETSLPQVGDIVADKYRIEGQLGEGGMALVFAAHHELLDKPIAVKILSPSLPRTQQLTDRFLTEARAAARVDSPHVARVMDVGTLVNGLPYMVMERLDGCDLAELLALEGPLKIGDAVDYTLQALQGLAHAHTLGVVHRDLKPANLFLAHQTDGSAIVKILDFGIAKLDTADRNTEAGQAVGSPMYMSPEHIRNASVDHRSDLWAMGVVLYELLTKRTPFEADGIGETFAAVLMKKPKGPRELRPEIPEDLDAAIMKCLEHEPDKRWADAAQFARAIAPYGTGMCAALVDNIEQTLRQTLRRYSGQAMMVRPQSSPRTEMAVTVEAPAEPSAASLRESEPPQFRSRRGWWVAIAVLASAGAAYGFFSKKLTFQQTAAPRVEAVIASASVSAPVASVAPAKSPVKTSGVVSVKKPPQMPTPAKPSSTTKSTSRP